MLFCLPPPSWLESVFRSALQLAPHLSFSCTCQLILNLTGEEVYLFIGVPSNPKGEAGPSCKQSVSTGPHSNDFRHHHSINCLKTKKPSS